MIAFLIVSGGFLESSSALLLGGVLGSDVLLQTCDYGDDFTLRNSMKSGKAIDDMIWVILMNPFMTVKAT